VRGTAESLHAFLRLSRELGLLRYQRPLVRELCNGTDGFLHQGPLRDLPVSLVWKIRGWSLPHAAFRGAEGGGFRDSFPYSDSKQQSVTPLWTRAL